ncbi:hypothetical protein ABIA96_005424 [Bradyrhizobium sp. LB11.1]
MVDTSRDPDAFQRSILMLGPQSAPLNKRLVTVPFAGFHPTQSRRRGLAQRQQNVGVVIVRMVPFFMHRRVNRDIGDHATADEGFLDEA